MPPHRQSHRAFGLTIGAALLVFSGLFFLAFEVLLIPVLAVAGLLWAAALVRPRSLWLLNRLWTATVARFMGWLLNHVILLSMFLLVVVPIGLLMRVLGRDTMGRRPAPAGGSYFQPVMHQTTAENLREIF